MVEATYHIAKVGQAYGRWLHPRPEPGYVPFSFWGLRSMETSDTLLLDEMPGTDGPGAEVSAVTDWLIGQGLRRTSFEQLLEGFCQRMIAIGVPLWRGFITAQTLHPRILGMACLWRADQGIRSDVYVHRLTPPDSAPNRSRPRATGRL
jgi:hypothetical protein